MKLTDNFVISTSTPSTMSLKHLSSRPKKQQLIDDRRQEIAKENRKLMENMAKVSPIHPLIPSKFLLIILYIMTTLLYLNIDIE